MKEDLLRYNVKGEGEPLLLLHGLFASGRNWIASLSRLSQFYKVYTPDLRNHGHSFHRATMTYEEMAEDVKTLCDQLELPAVSLIGHSMGGKTAMVFALKYPDRVKDLIVSDIAPITYQRRFETVLKALGKLSLDSISSLKMAEEALFVDIPDRTLVRFLLTNLQKDQASNRYFWRLNLKGIQDGMEDIRSFPKLDRHPFERAVLFLKGETSHHISGRHTSDRLRLFPNSQVVTIEKAGHNIHTDNKDLFLDVALDFLRRG